MRGSVPTPYHMPLWCTT